MSDLDTLYDHVHGLFFEAKNVKSRMELLAGSESEEAYKAAVDVSVLAIRCAKRIKQARSSGDCKPDSFDALLHRIETGTTTPDDAEIVRQIVLRDDIV